MQAILTSKLHEYLLENNPDIIAQLQTDSHVTDFLENRVELITPLIDELLNENTPASTIYTACINEMTADLRPSKYQFISTILAEEFEDFYATFSENGTLSYEIINILSTCSSVFDAMPLTEESEDDRLLHYTIIGCIDEYLNP